MKQSHIATSSTTINAQAAKIWEALTNPETIKQYLFGTNVETDWKEGSPIIWKGEWQGTEYEDKGTVLKVVPERLLETTYWSSMSGKTDSPENYNNVKYELSEGNAQTIVTITQDNNPTEESKKHSEENWNMVLKGLKELLEK
ncbi:MAG: SRPBCC domain-containing protein [Candidatus Kerfeldbacteria bacterium]|nr:SRPBCC domain-containing protein [Candidatus Kerfeldbacteria bacterium]